MEGTIGYTTLFAGNFAPKNWAMCNGQLLAIAQNTALFSILGTTYGGNGTTNFALPDLRGRAVVGAGQGPGLSYYDLGQLGGIESTTLTVDQMPMHAHSVSATVTPGAATTASTSSPQNGVYGTGTDTLFAAVTDGLMQPYNAALTTQPIGNNMPVSILHPLLCLNYVICMQGIFPARN
jgi:microcystin-dependent protein